MNKLECEICHSSDIKKQDDFFVCSNCGIKYTVEQLSALFAKEPSSQENTKQDFQSNLLTKETETLFLLARRAREDMNVADGEKYYGELLKHYPNNWEIVFFHVYFQVFGTKIIAIHNASTLLSNSLDNVYLLVFNLADSAAQSDALATINHYLNTIAMAFSNSIKDLYRKTCGTDLNALSRYTQYMAQIHSIYGSAEKNIKNHFPNCKTELVDIQKAYAASLMRNSSLVPAKELKDLTSRLESEIKLIEPDYTLPETDNYILNSAKRIKNKLDGFLKGFSTK